MEHNQRAPRKVRPVTYEGGQLDSIDFPISNDRRTRGYTHTYTYIYILRMNISTYKCVYGSSGFAAS